MSSSIYDDDGYELIAIVDSPEIRQEGKRQFFKGLEVQFSRGQDYLGREPVAALQWSNDNGNTWSNELHAPMGNIGAYSTRSTWRRLGSGYNGRLG